MQLCACPELDFCEIKLTEVFPFLVTRINSLSIIKTFASRKLSPALLTLSKRQCPDMGTPLHFAEGMSFLLPHQNPQLCQLPSDKHKFKLIPGVKPSSYELLPPKYEAAHASIGAPEHFFIPSWKILKGAVTAETEQPASHKYTSYTSIHRN